MASFNKDEIVDDQQVNKRQKIIEGNDDVVCAVCMRDVNELMTAECPMMDEHNCPQCNKASWKICEECEETVLSRKCPVCRGEYAPIILYEFPDLQPNLHSGDKAKELKLFQAKMSLFLKLVGGSNTAVYLPGHGCIFH